MSTNIRLTNFHRLNLFNDTSRIVKLAYGADIYNNESFGKIFLSEGFGKVNLLIFQFQAGVFRETTGEMDAELSSGSLGISGNALPIPKLKLSIPVYTNLPFGKGKVQFKGSLSHGWMGRDRYMTNSYYHEKTLYGRINFSKWRIFAGVQHFTEWGGNRGDFRLDRSFAGFLDVLFVKEANDGSLDVDIYPGMRPNRAGDQRGLLEVGAEFEKENYKLRVYNQTPFEGGKGIDIRNIDRLLGVTLSSKKNRSFFQDAVVEFIHTKQMESYGNSERQSYYNNGVYANGWEYQDRIIGTPLFTNRVNGSKFLPVEPFDWKTTKVHPGNKNIINNRIIGGHIGMKYRLSEYFNAKTLLTYTVNFGNHNSEVIPSPQSQLYSLQQIGYHLNKHVELNFSLGLDVGEFYDNFGTLLEIKYYIKKN